MASQSSSPVSAWARVSHECRAGRSSAACSRRVSTAQPGSAASMASTSRTWWQKCQATSRQTSSSSRYFSAPAPPKRARLGGHAQGRDHAEVEVGGHARHAAPERVVAVARVAVEAALDEGLPAREPRAGAAAGVGDRRDAVVHRARGDERVEVALEVRGREGQVALEARAARAAPRVPSRASACAPWRWPCGSRRRGRGPCATRSRERRSSRRPRRAGRPGPRPRGARSSCGSARRGGRPRSPRRSCARGPRAPGCGGRGGRGGRRSGSPALRGRGRARARLRGRSARAGPRRGGGGRPAPGRRAAAGRGRSPGRSPPRGRGCSPRAWRRGSRAARTRRPERACARRPGRAGRGRGEEIGDGAPMAGDSAGGPGSMPGIQRGARDAQDCDPSQRVSAAPAL